MKTRIRLLALTLAVGLASGCRGFDATRDTLPPAPHLVGIPAGPVDLSPPTPRYRYRLGSTYIDGCEGKNRKRACTRRWRR